MAKVLLNRAGLAAVLSAIERRGYTIVGPKVTGTAVSYQRITSLDDLPHGWTSHQASGRYRLARRDDDLLFAYGAGLDSLKKFLHPPTERVWAATRTNGTLQFEPIEQEAPKLAVVGARPCELAAMARLDDVFLHGAAVDPSYHARRAGLFLVAANCTDPGDTCFCASMKTGPRAAALFDLALTELAADRVVVEIGSGAGADVLAGIPAAEAGPDAIDEERQALARAADRMGRRVETDGLPAALQAGFDHPEWEAVGSRCLACANCTMVCPTCFCHTIDDRTSLSGERIERQRRWDTCFGAEFSYIHGGSVRPSVAARYRQFAMHKFAHWTQQFGSFGCVGCGRCITWCPGGIDVTEEIRRVWNQNPSARS